MQRLAETLDGVILGKPRAVRLALTCLIAKGHLLIEDVPGVGKTTLAESLARVFGLAYGRIQFTSDLLPSDILGAQIYRAQTGEFVFRHGPIFNQLVLGDELNRAPPRTQSALLEAMAHGQVSLDGHTHRLPQPFHVIATQNSLDAAGTYPLPDSQLDRFLFCISLGHLDSATEVRLLTERHREAAPPLVGVADPDSLTKLQAAASAVKIGIEVADYAVRLGAATRSHPEVERGASTRAMLSLIAGARAHALWESRDFAIPQDIRTTLIPTLAHRIVLKTPGQGALARHDAGRILEEILLATPVPR